MGYILPVEVAALVNHHNQENNLTSSATQKANINGQIQDEQIGTINIYVNYCLTANLYHKMPLCHRIYCLLLENSTGKGFERIRQTAVSGCLLPGWYYKDI